MVAARQGEAEEVRASLDGRAEWNHDAGHVAAVGFAEVARVGGDVGIGEDVAHDVLLKRLLPGGVVVGAGGIVDEAEEFTAEGEDGAVLFGVVDTEAGFDDGPIGGQHGHRTGEAGIAAAGGGLRRAAGEITEGAGGDDGVERGLTGGGTEQAGFVVVAFRRKVGVARCEIEEGAVLLQCLVAEGAERKVLGPVALDECGGALAENEALGLDAVALGDEGADFFVGALKVGGLLDNFHETAGELLQAQLVLVSLLDFRVAVVEFRDGLFHIIFDTGRLPPRQSGGTEGHDSRARI